MPTPLPVWQVCNVAIFESTTRNFRDAICQALFFRSPRLNSLSQPISLILVCHLQPQNPQRHLRSSALGANEEIELIVVDLQALVAKLRRDYFQPGIVRPLTKADQEDEVNFRNLCSGSAELAEEIIERLSKLRVGPQLAELGNGKA